mmetsp:Transcript_78927/g.229236  ORF Transcript_78927/g.229236 Transcript_78927/m.229236 type:complete len:232 (+) Transcript_78927:165-860(+)
MCLRLQAAQAWSASSWNGNFTYAVPHLFPFFFMSMVMSSGVTPNPSKNATMSWTVAVKGIPRMNNLGLASIKLLSGSDAIGHEGVMLSNSPICNDPSSCPLRGVSNATCSCLDASAHRGPSNSPSEATMPLRSARRTFNACGRWEPRKSKSKCTMGNSSWLLLACPMYSLSARPTIFFECRKMSASTSLQIMKPQPFNGLYVRIRPTRLNRRAPQSSAMPPAWSPRGNLCL